MSTLNELIAADMSGLNEGHPHGVPSYYDFYSGPVVVMGNNPEGNSAIEWWMGMYVDAGGNPATNTIVNFRNARLYWFNTQTNAWVAGLDTNVFDVGFYAEDYSVDYGTGPTIRHESDGSISFGTVAGKVAHGYAPWPRIPFDPAHFGGVVSVLEARLILDNGAGADDRASAKYLVSVGGDYYPSTTGAGIENNPGIAGGKLKYVTSDWQLFAMTTLTQVQLDALPALPFTFGGTSSGVGGTTGGSTITGGGGTGVGGSFQYYQLLITSTDTGLTNPTPSVAEWDFYDSAGTQISTSGGTAAASSTFGGSPGTYDAPHAFDGDASTFWNANASASVGSPQWLRMQFASPVSVDHFTLTSRNDGFHNQCPAYFSLQASNDGSVWTTIWTYEAAVWDNTSGETKTFYTTGIVYRVAVTATQVGGSFATAIADLKLFDLAGAPVATSPGTYLGSSYSSGHPPQDGFAGNCTQGWVSRNAVAPSPSAPQWLAFHFPGVVNVGSFSFQSLSASETQAPSAFTLDESQDGANWTTLQTYAAGTWVSGCQTQTFSVPAALPPAPASIQVTPNVGSQCHSYTINVAGINTHFDGTTTVAISGTGATVSGVSVTSATSLTFSLALSCTATLGARTVTVTTGGEILTDGFSVAATTFPSALVRNNIAWSQLRLGQDGRFGIGTFGASTDGSGLPGDFAMWGGPDGKTLVGSGTPGGAFTVNGGATVTVNGADASFDNTVTVNGA